MSNSAFPHGTNASAVGGVSLQDLSFVHSGSSAVRTAGIRINTNGTVQWLRTFQEIELNPLTDWLIPNGSGAAYDVRLTNLVWATKDEGFIHTPSGTTTHAIPNVGPYDGDSDGDEDTWYDLGTSREWVFIDDDSDLGTGIQDATFDIQIRRGGTVLATAAMDWFVNSGGGGGGGGGGCFMYDTQIRMADNTLKNIQDIVIGDVMKEGGKVKATQIGDATNETWYDCDGVIATGTHTICKDGTWMGVEDAGYPVADEQPETFYVVSNMNHKILADGGQLFTDYQEVDYISSGWDDWVVDFLNGNSDVDVLRNAIISTGLESQRAKDYLAREGIYEDDYNEKKNRLLQELDELERLKEINDIHISDMTKKHNPEVEETTP